MLLRFARAATVVTEISESYNCYRCGQEFRRPRKQRVCPACRVPKPRKPATTLLSLRERQVTALVAKGKLNKEIAHALHLTEGTVKEYLNRIFKKVGCTNRTELAVGSLTRPEMQSFFLVS